MTRDEFIAARPIELEFASRGVKVTGGGKQRMAKCPFHEDGSASLSINVELGVWKCHAGCGGGSVIDAIAKFENCQPADVLKRECSPANGNGAPRRFPVTATQRSVPVKETAVAPISAPKPTIETIYPYHDAFGDEVYQALRLKPKSFRQRHGKEGAWIWNMDGVERVLYRLPEVMRAEEVWVVEGEKDVETLRNLGFTATTNVGGAGKWLDGYTEYLKGKRVVLCGDNDEPGKAHVQSVFDSIAGVAKEVRIVTVPAPHKDVSELAAELQNGAKASLELLRDGAVPFLKGVRLPIYPVEDLQDDYARYCQSIDTVGLNLGKWLPGFGRLRILGPGDMVTIAAATGVGKTAILSNLVLAAAPMGALFFQLELSREILYERLMALRVKMSCAQIEEAYKGGEKHGHDFFQKAFPGLFISTETAISVAEIAAMVTKAELRMGEKPKIVLVDYMGLIKGDGTSRYDRFSSTAEALRVMAKVTRTIVVVASQIQRKKDDDSPEVGTHDAKESGSIENSSSLLIGAWRDKDRENTLVMRVNKGSRGGSGTTVFCNYNPDTLAITEQARYADQDKDQWHNK
jgi:KaiC/GvpD/RAD55 family RecA-like ATPase